MSASLKSALAGAFKTLRTSLGDQVAYSRGTQTAYLTAIMADVLYEVTTGDGGTETWSSRDFLMEAAALKLGGVVVEPARGDRIEAESQAWEVVGPGNQPCFEYSDPYKLGLRVHTRGIGVVN